MTATEIIIVTVGLVLFEVVSSIDNAVINAKVLVTMSAKSRRWFLLYGLFLSVFLVRGLLPLLIVYLANPQLGLFGAATAAFSSSPDVARAVETTRPILLAGGGLYLVLLSIHWLLLEPKEYCFKFERRLQNYGIWFYALASVILVGVTFITLNDNPLIALGAVIGSSAFFITSGFKASSEDKESDLATSKNNDWSKLLYLEMIDATFSIDGVLGAFAFTTAVPLILLGSGIGALVVRHITVKGTEFIGRYRYLSNGAMYSIAALGTVMLAESLHYDVPFWVSPIITIIAIIIFGYRSYQEVQGQKATTTPAD